MKKKVAVVVFFLGLLLSLIAMQQQRLTALQERSLSTQEVRRQKEVIATNLALSQKLPTFGFDNLVADWFFLRFLQYLGDTEARKQTDYSLSPDFFRIIISRDPYYRMFYFFMSVSTSTLAAQPEVSVDLMAQGLTHLSPTMPADSFYIWRYKGTDELLFLGDGVAAQRSFQTSADWARQSSHPDAAIIGENSQATAIFLANNPDSRFAQIDSWFSVLANAFDDATRQRAIERIEALGGRILPNEDGSFSIQLPPED
jgi:hypothetical protein